MLTTRPRIALTQKPKRSLLPLWIGLACLPFVGVGAFLAIRHQEKADRVLEQIVKADRDQRESLERLASEKKRAERQLALDGLRIKLDAEEKGRELDRKTWELKNSGEPYEPIWPKRDESLVAFMFKAVSNRYAMEPQDWYRWVIASGFQICNACDWKPEDEYFGVADCDTCLGSYVTK